MGKLKQIFLDAPFRRSTALVLCANFMVQQFYDKITNLCYHHLSGAFKRHFLQETTQIKFQTKPSTVTMENVYLICYLNFKGIFK